MVVGGVYQGLGEGVEGRLVVVGACTKVWGREWRDGWWW